MAAAKQSFVEAEFLLAWPPETNPAQCTLGGYIDRLYQDEHGAWHVVDFKTNRVPAAGVAAIAANYELQMLVYALAAETILGSPPASVTLHFLRTGDEHRFAWDALVRGRADCAGRPGNCRGQPTRGPGAARQSYFCLRRPDSIIRAIRSDSPCQECAGAPDRFPQAARVRHRRRSPAARARVRSLLGRRLRARSVARASRPRISTWPPAPSPTKSARCSARAARLPIGAAFGVITVVGPRSAGQIEVATFRQDASYSDGRHPDSVQFSTPAADAERRDFTINGMFYDPVDDRVIDFVGGRDDLARRIIRAIGDPRARFAEDKLRLLRAVRFASAFDFTLDPATRSALEVMAPQVTVVSIERIAAELRQMLVQENRVQAMVMLRETGLLAAVLPELAVVEVVDGTTPTGRPADDAWAQALNVLATLDSPTFPLALAALAHPFIDEAAGQALCRRLKLANRDVNRTRWLLANQHALADARNTAWPKLQRLLTAEGASELVALHAAIAAATGRHEADVEHCRALMALPPAELDPPPLVTGDDLLAHGVPRGKHYQNLLEAVRDAQLEKQIATRQDALALVDRLALKR